MAIGTPNLFMNANNTVSNSGSPSQASLADAPAGSLIVVSVSAVGNGPTISTLVDSAGNTYVLAVAQIGPRISNELWYCSNTPNDLPLGGTFTATTSGGGTWYMAGAASISGCNGGLDKTNTFAATSQTTYSLSTGTLSVANELVIGNNVPQAGSFAGYVEDSKFTELTNPITSNSASDFAYDIVSATTSITWAPSWTSGVNVSAAIATFEATPSPAFGIIGLAACEY